MHRLTRPVEARLLSQAARVVSAGPVADAPAQRRAEVPAWYRHPKVVRPVAERGPAPPHPAQIPHRYYRPGFLIVADRWRCLLLLLHRGCWRRHPEAEFRGKHHLTLRCRRGGWHRLAPRVEYVLATGVVRFQTRVVALRPLAARRRRKTARRIRPGTHCRSGRRRNRRNHGRAGSCRVSSYADS